MATWLIRAADEEAVATLAGHFGLPRAIARSLVVRGYDTVAALGGFLAARESLTFLDEPIATPGMERAVARIRKAVADQEPMVIYGDYDCDGVTSTSLLYRYLKRGMGANVTAFLPHRIRDGYGVTPAAIARLAAQGAKVILTCDNGIAAHAAALAAKDAGLDLIITDHHTVPPELPEAHAIVHPQIEFKHLKDLAGVGVAYMLALALAGGRSDKMDFLMDFVTLGTVADMVPLNGPNRPLVWAGLERLRRRKSVYPGLATLMDLAKVTPERFGSTDIAFRLGPRLNAAGRIEEPDVGLRLLTTNDKAEAMTLAQKLERLNAERRTLNAELETEILGKIDREWDLTNEPFVVLGDRAFHPGITGIVAGRIKERYGVPVLLFSPHEDGIWKASGRSPETVHLYDALDHVREHLLGFGGHAQAAGCSAREEELPAIRAALNRYLAEIGWVRPPEVVGLDAELPFHEANREFLARLDALEPFGQKNPAPVFGLMRVRVLSRKVIDGHLDLKLDDGRSMRSVRLWNRASDADRLVGWVQLTYRLRPSHREPSGVAITVDRIEPVAAPAAIDLSPLRPKVRLDDRRKEPVNQVVAELAENPEVVFLGRRLMDHATTALDVFSIEPPAGKTLVLVGPPPDESIWARLQVGAANLILVGEIAPPVEEPLSPAELREIYRELADGLPLALAELSGRLPHVDPYRLAEAVAIFREAGIAVVRHAVLRMLAAPGSDILLRALESYRLHREAIAFRRRWVDA